MINKLLVLIIIFIGSTFSSWAQTELLGEITKEEILQSFPDWEVVMTSYSPDTEVLDQLQAIAYLVEIEVVLGTWCPDSKRHVSEYFKVIEMVSNPNFQSDYIGIPRNKEARAAYIEGKNIQKVPTFIVRVDGQEIGRIIEIPTQSIEHDLLEILKR